MRACTMIAALVLLFGCGKPRTGSRHRDAASTTRPSPPADAAIVWPDARPVRPDVGEPPADMVRVPAGRFLRPCPPDLPDCRKPNPEIELDEFYIDKTEVTVSAFRECVDAGACDAPDVSSYPCKYDSSWLRKDRDAFPMDCVGFMDAWDYCKFRGKRLPTQEEWLMAAVGTDGRVFPWGNARATCQRAVLWEPGKADCGTGSALPVGTKLAGKSPCGALDMIGNVSEIVVTLERPGWKPLPRDVFAMGGHYLTTTKDVATDWLGDTRLPSPEVGFRCIRRPAGHPDPVATELRL